MRPRLILVNPPIGRYDTAEIAPPLSLLVLAAAARDLGYEVAILDLNLPVHRPHADDDGFYTYAVDMIASLHPAHVAVTSMGVNTHVAMRLASLAASALGCPVAIGGI